MNTLGKVSEQLMDKRMHDSNNILVPLIMKGK